MSPYHCLPFTWFTFQSTDLIQITLFHLGFYFQFNSNSICASFWFDSNSIYDKVTKFQFHSKSVHQNAKHRGKNGQASVQFRFQCIKVNYVFQFEFDLVSQIILIQFHFNFPTLKVIFIQIINASKCKIGQNHKLNYESNTLNMLK